MPSFGGMTAVEWEEADFRIALRTLEAQGTIDGSGKRVSKQHVANIRENAPHEGGRPRLARADFRNACFVDEVAFQQIRFAGEALFDNAEFEGTADFHDAVFEGSAMFADTTFHCDALFTNAAFRASVTLGPLRVRRRLVFDGAIFDEDGQIKAEASQLSCIRTRFVGRADLKLRWAQVILDDALFLQRSWLSGSPAFADLKQDPPPLDHDWAGDEHGSLRQERPKLLSMREANVANLSLSDVDLRACRFAKAQGLDQLRLEADCEFAGVPGGWRHTKRRTLAEEHHWRSRLDAGSAQWHPVECQPPSWLDSGDRPVEVLDPPRIAALYRSLRKALEDSKDEPGAGDFYYGEMEMRRQHLAETPETRAQGRRIPGAERRIVSIYWVLSGYGLRASRALGLLVLLIAVSAVGLHLYGFKDRVRPYAATTDLQAQPAYGAPSPRELLDGLASIEAWTYSIGTATAIVGAPEAQLTQTGRGMRIALRILGPVLIGLALLAIRGRVRR